MKTMDYQWCQNDRTKTNSLTFGMNRMEIKNCTKYLKTLYSFVCFFSVAVKPNQMEISVLSIMQLNKFSVENAIPNATGAELETVVIWDFTTFIYRSFSICLFGSW